MKLAITTTITILVLALLLGGLIELNNSENKKLKKEQMGKRKRPCEVDTTIHRHNGIKFKGLFHEFGQEAIESETGFGNYTIAIVEDESGQVHTVNPNHVKFLDK